MRRLLVGREIGVQPGIAYVTGVCSNADLPLACIAEAFEVEFVFSKRPQMVQYTPRTISSLTEARW